MTPNWNNAPEWAKYAAMDGNGDWFFYEFKPVFVDGNYWSVTDKNHRFSFAIPIDRPEPSDSLTERPL